MAELSELESAQAAFSQAAATASASQGWSADLIKSLSLSVLGFTFLVLVLATVLLLKKDHGAQQVLRAFGLITIIGMSAFLMVVGYSNEQLTPIIGLFGAIAGYLLGKDASKGE